MQVSLGGHSKSITQLLAGVAGTKVGLMLQTKHSGASFNRGDCGYCGLGPVEPWYQWDNSRACGIDWTAHEVPEVCPYVQSIVLFFIDIDLNIT